MSARKRRNRRENRRQERKQFRAATRSILGGGRVRKAHFGSSWSGVKGMRGRDLPLDIDD